MPVFDRVFVVCRIMQVPCRMRQSPPDHGANAAKPRSEPQMRTILPTQLTRETSAHGGNDCRG